MFTSNFTDETKQSSYRGVDLKHYDCFKLTPNPIYSNYAKNHLHFPIGALQKGLKPHTQKGIKRLLKRQKIRKQKKQKQLKSNDSKSSVPLLNPRSPQYICMKALRTQFRAKLEQNFVQAEKPAKQTKKAKYAKRKQYQRLRRQQLIKIVKLYRKQLYPRFGERLNGFGRCPKVSRNQICEYLKTKGIIVERVNISKPVAMDIEKPINSKPIQKGLPSFSWVPQMQIEARKQRHVPIFKEEDFPVLK